VADLSALDQIYRRLDGLGWALDADGHNVAVTLPLDAAAADIFEAWVAENQVGLDDAGSLYKGFCGKLRGTVLRLSLVSEMVAWASGNGADEPRSISARTVAAAIEFVEEYAKPSALRVFGDAALPPVERHAATVARYIQRNKVKRLNARDLRRRANLPGLKEANAVNEALALLAEADWLRACPQREGATPGRQTSDFMVNPAVHGGVDG
jgi:putative DNA primase/helicase